MLAIHNITVVKKYYFTTQACAVCKTSHFYLAYINTHKLRCLPALSRLISLLVQLLSGYYCTDLQWWIEPGFCRIGSKSGHCKKQVQAGLSRSAERNITVAKFN